MLVLGAAPGPFEVYRPAVPVNEIDPAQVPGTQAQGYEELPSCASSPFCPVSCSSPPCPLAPEKGRQLIWRGGCIRRNIFRKINCELWCGAVDVDSARSKKNGPTACSKSDPKPVHPPTASGMVRGVLDISYENTTTHKPIRRRNYHWGFRPR